MQARTEAEREYEAAWSVARRQNEMMAYVAVRLLGHAERAHGFAIACDGAAMRLGQAEARGPWEDYARGAWNDSDSSPTEMRRSSGRSAIRPRGAAPQNGAPRP